MEPIIDGVEAVPSADNGNVPVDAKETPSVPATPVTPPTPVEEVAKPAPELFKLPDGREVDAQTLSKEWKENFYPDYTRKSQALAAKEAPKPVEVDPYANPDYVPASYKEIEDRAMDRALKAMDSREQQRVERQQQIETDVVNQLTEIKKTDASLNENALFLHANKYGFRDLKVAHQNMKDMAELAKTVQQNTVKNIAKRSDPVSITPGATGARPNPSNFSNAVDYLRSLNK